MYNCSNDVWIMTCLTGICSILILVIIPLPCAIAKSDTVGHFIYQSQLPTVGNNYSSSISENTSKELMTLTQDKSNYKFVSVGDWGCTQETDKTVKNIIERDPNLIVGLGDYSYSNSEKCWIDKIRPIEELFKIVLGNHENVQNYPLSVFESLRYSTPDSYMSAFGLEKQYYSFDYGNVHFLMMSTEVPYQNGTAQYNFASNDLARASKDSNTKWIIVANHRTVYPPYYGPSIVLDASIGKKFRETYHPLFDFYGVDLVLQGHVHYYQRTYPIKYNTANSDAPLMMDIHKSHYINPLAPIFITVGTGGVEIGQPDMISKPYYEAFTKTGIYGILDIVINKDGSALKGTFYNNGGNNRPYAQDIFTIIK